MHPPYHDIIKFSSDKNDLSGAESTEQIIVPQGRLKGNDSRPAELRPMGLSYPPSLLAHYGNSDKADVSPSAAGFS